MASVVSESHPSGTAPGAGTFSCSACGFQVSLGPLDSLPDCPGCGATSFERSSIFEGPLGPGAHGHGAQQTVEFAATAEHAGSPAWLRGAREGLPPGGRYLLCQDHEPGTYELDRGWSRIGRSATADLRLDDPSVSRRHALVVWEPDEPIRILDDRSLNGIALNGAPIDWGTMVDGDELRIGRYRLYLVET